MRVIAAVLGNHHSIRSDTTSGNRNQRSSSQSVMGVSHRDRSSRPSWERSSQSVLFTRASLAAAQSSNAAICSHVQTPSASPAAIAGVTPRPSVLWGRAKLRQGRTGQFCQLFVDPAAGDVLPSSGRDWDSSAAIPCQMSVLAGRWRGFGVVEPRRPDPASPSAVLTHI